MLRWQRVARLVLAVFAIGFAIVVARGLRERTPSVATTPGPRTDPEAIAESVGGSTLLARGTERDFQIEYARALTYADGTLKFEDVTVNVPQRGGRDFVVTAKTAVVTNNQAHVEMEGQVRLAASDGLVITAEKSTYDSNEGIVRVPGPVQFSRERMRGSGVGATYDRDRDVLWLLDQAHIVIAPAPDGTGDADVTAGAAGFARRDRYLRFERSVRMLRGGQVVEADNAVAYLAAESDTLQMIELRGSSRVTGKGEGAGSLDAMSARDMNLTYLPDGQTLERAALAAGAVVQLAGEPGQAGRRLSAEWIDLALSSDGRTLTSLAARESVQLELPPDAPGAATRRIRSVTLEASGPPGEAITRAHFATNVEFREVLPAARGKAAVERTARSQTLDTTTAPGFGAIEAAVFAGGVTFRDADLEGIAPDATYDVTKGTLRLVAPGADRARVTDDRVSIQASTIDVTLDGHGLDADGDVRSLLKASGERPASDGTQVRRAGMLKDDQPVNVTSRHLTYDQATGLAVYTTDARLWQGETAIQAQTITIDDAAGNLTAKTGVRSTLRLLDTDQKTGKTEAKTTILTSQDMVYEDESRKATYTVDARMVGPEGDLRADRIELFLDEAGSALERAEAYDKVSLRSEQRYSTGERLTYFAADARYVMRGNPVRALEQLPTECRETLGRTLTFYRSTDSITVDGNDERRTQTTSGGKCSEPRS